MKKRIVSLLGKSICILTMLLFFTFSQVIPNELNPEYKQYFISDEVTLLTEYNSDLRKKVRVQTWNARKSNIEENGFKISFYLSEKNSTPICSTTIHKKNETTAIAMKDTDGFHKNGANGILIVPGYPAPCDIILNDEDRTIEEVYHAGGRTFSRRFEIIHQEVTKNEAVSNGWIDKSLSIFDKPMTMIVVKDQRGEALVKQLWTDNDSWWIYEETPDRRSWRILK